jgi:hypothetical protein
VAPGYTDPVQWIAGNPYGASSTSNNGQLSPTGVEIRAARYLGRRTATMAERFHGGGDRVAMARPQLSATSPIHHAPFFEPDASHDPRG